MRSRWSFVLISAMALACLAPAPLLAGGKKEDEPKQVEKAKDVVVNSELIAADPKDRVLTQSHCKTYTYKMVQGRTYQIDLMSRDFDAFLRLETPGGQQVAADDDGGEGLNSRIVYRAPQTGDFQIFAMSLGGGSTGKFTLIVRDVTDPAQAKNKAVQLKLEKGQAVYNGNLGANEPTYKNKRHRPLEINLVAGKTYQSDMMSQDFDCYLFLENPKGQLIAQDDDGGDGLNSRIVIRAQDAGVHRIIATYFGNGSGQFTVTVRETE